MAELEALPAEILDNIASFLPYTSALGLAWTCRTIYGKLDKKVLEWTASAHLNIVFDLLILEQWPIFERHLACGYCHKLLPMSHFTLRQVHRYEKNKYNIQYMLKAQEKLQEREEAGRASPTVTKTRRPLVSNKNDLTMEVAARLCIACGIRGERYGPGEELHFPIDPDPNALGDEPTYGSGIVCKVCRNFVVTDPNSRAGSLRQCDDCLGPTPGFHDKMFKYY